MTPRLFDPDPLILIPGMILLPGAAPDVLLDLALTVMEAAPPRAMMTPMGKPMAAEITNCGDSGWVSDASGYRYAAQNPETGEAWPAMPEPFKEFAAAVAARAGFPNYAPDVCLINRYHPGTRMGLHQDRDERDFSQPIVSVSFGASALFRFGGIRRRDPSRGVTLHHGDVVVFGGPARLVHHGIDRIHSGHHPKLQGDRINLTFRRAG